MYVDKPLSGIKAVQTLSRLNRAHPKKYDVFVLDFQNDTDTIEVAFSDYYRTTVLSKETDPNKLHDLKADLDGYQVYAPEHIDELVDLYLGGANRDKLDPILDACVATYKEELDEGQPGRFQGKGQSIPAGLRIPGVYPAIHERGVGKTLDLSDLPGPEAARAERGGPVKGHPRSDRYGQLLGGEKGRYIRSASRRGCGDRARAGIRRWPQG